MVTLTLQLFFIKGARRLKLAMSLKGELKLFLEDGCQIFEDAEILDETIVQGKTLTIAFSVDDVMDESELLKHIKEKYDGKKSKMFIMFNFWIYLPYILRQ
jgi:hypothetical protein